jgi:hypothetical protein
VHFIKLRMGLVGHQGLMGEVHVPGGLWLPCVAEHGTGICRWREAPGEHAISGDSQADAACSIDANE